MAPMQQTIGATANPNTKIFLAIIFGSYIFSGYLTDSIVKILNIDP
jgi:hypothetical protein